LVFSTDNQQHLCTVNSIEQCADVYNETEISVKTVSGIDTQYIAPDHIYTY